MTLTDVLINHHRLYLKYEPRWQRCEPLRLFTNTFVLVAPIPIRQKRFTRTNETLNNVVIFFFYSTKNFFITSNAGFVLLVINTHGERKHYDVTCKYRRRNSKIFVKSTSPQWASMVDHGQGAPRSRL